VNRKLLVVVAVAAVLALLAGAAVGRNLLSSATPEEPRADVVRFKDEISKVSIAYPAAWTRLADRPDEPDLALLVAKDDTATMLMRISNVGLEEVTKTGLPVVRKFTDGLLAEDPRIRQLQPPVSVDMGGLLGWRYRYVFGPGEGTAAHDHYFLFKGGRMIQLVFEAVPARLMPTLAPTFDGIAASFRGREA
jgi:hypothetical protein